MPKVNIDNLPKPKDMSLSEFNTKLALQTVNSGLAVLKKSVDELQHRDLRKPNVAELARIFSYMAKGIDELARLTLFIQGGPDSRPDLGLDSVFARLNLEQIKTLESWLSPVTIDVTPIEDNVNNNL